MADQLGHLKKEVIKIEILDGKCSPPDPDSLGRDANVDVGDHAAKDIGSGEISIEGIPLGSYTEVINNTAGVLVSHPSQTQPIIKSHGKSIQCIRYGANTGILGAVIEGFKQVVRIFFELISQS